MDKDEGIRYDTSLEKLAGLKPSFLADGVVTAGNSSQISDGSAALLLMAADTARGLGLRPRARIVAQVMVGVDPHIMLTGPIPATRAVLKRAGLTLADIDLIEINEAFASVVLAWQKELQPDMSRVNVGGGAIALGHPLGSTGAKLMTTPALRAGAHRRPLRPADHVLRRRHGHRDDHREAVGRRRGRGRSQTCPCDHPSVLGLLESARTPYVDRLRGLP